MSEQRGVHVANDGILAHAERLLAGPVATHDLALAFDEELARSTDLFVEGTSFSHAHARRHRRRHLVGARQPVRLQAWRGGQRVRRAVGHQGFEGVAVRLVVDGPRLRSERAIPRDVREKLYAAGVTVCVVRATKPPVQSGPMGTDGPVRWNLTGLGHFDHRKC